jgi:hypothetical protein
MRIRTKIGQWICLWEGGRLADVSHVSNPSSAVDCFQVGDYDFVHGRLTETITRDKLRLRFKEWIAEDGECFYENVVRYQ